MSAAGRATNEGTQRKVHATSRAADFLEPRSLQSQTGQPVSGFAAVVLKEGMDNGLDAPESAGRQPEVILRVERSSKETVIAIADNGLGMSDGLIEQILDFSVLVSDKSAYRSPTRGQQGNALKTIIGIPTALDCEEPIVIKSLGIKHDIRVSIADTVGTSITVTVPSAGAHDLDVVDWARSFAIVNPHANIRCELAEWPEQEVVSFYNATVGEGWRKPLPTDTTSPHWYDEAALRKLIRVHINDSRRGAADVPIGEFVRSFTGLSSSMKAKAVCRIDKLKGIARLSDFDGNDELVAVLLAAMKEYSKPPKPSALGQVPMEHYLQCFDDWFGVDPERFWFKRVPTSDGVVPWVVEIAIAETMTPGGIFFATNYSATFDDPLDRLILPESDIYSVGVSSFLSQLDALPNGSNASRAVAVHVICPAVSFLDKGKTTLVTGDNSGLGEDIAKALVAAGKVLWTEKKRKRRVERRVSRENSQQVTCTSLKDAVFAVLPKAMDHASGGGSLPVPARSLYYAVRPLVQDQTAKPLDYNYFSQTLLVDYQHLYGPMDGLVREARGHLREPHTGRTVPLGTLEVAHYDLPSYVYNKVLYVEKQGLDPIWHASKLGERYDMAIASGKGQPVEAVRTLFQRAEAGDFQLFVLHDADPAGYIIARTIAEETRRMPDHSVKVIDLGMKVADAVEMGLVTERFSRKVDLPAWMPERLNEVESEWFVGRPSTHSGNWDCTRVELNALTGPDLVTYVERGLASNGADTKIHPPDEVVMGRVASVLSGTISSVVSRTFDDAIATVKERVGRETQSQVTVDQDPVLWQNRIAEAYECDRSSTWEEAIHRGIGQELTGSLDDVPARAIELLIDLLREMPGAS
jgi:DNA topoisomerase VI subunit B